MFNYSKLFILLLSINLGIIFADFNKCTSIEHCDKCPIQGKCETCEYGYTLNFEQTKCILLQSTEDSNKNNTNTKNYPQFDSLKNSGNNTVQKTSNDPITSNKPFSSAFNINNLEGQNYKSLFYKIILVLVIGFVLFLCIKYCLNRKKKGKFQYFYDPNGNPEEKAKVVYIQ